MFLSREIDIKLCKNYLKIHIYAILCKSSRFYKDHFQQYKLYKTLIHIRITYMSFAITLTQLNFLRHGHQNSHIARINS